MSKKKLLIFGIILLVIFFLFRICLVNFELEIVQIFVAPCLLIVLLGISRQLKIKFPQQIIYLYLILICICGLAWFTSIGNVHTIVLARLDGDKDDSQSRILKSALNGESRKYLDYTVGRYFNNIKSLKEAEKFIVDSKLNVLIWGSLKRITISFPEQKNEDLSNLLILKDLPEAKLKIVYNVSKLSLPYQPYLETKAFILHFLRYFNSAIDAPDAALDFAELVFASRVYGPWRSNTHVGAAEHFIGNIYLKRFLQNNTSLSDLSAAEKYYLRAAKIIRIKDEPELWIANMNNLAVVSVLDNILNFNPKKRKLANKLFRSAGTSIPWNKTKNGIVAYQNHLILKSINRKKNNAKE